MVFEQVGTPLTHELLDLKSSAMTFDLSYDCRICFPIFAGNVLKVACWLANGLKVDMVWTSDSNQIGQIFD